MVDTKEEKGIEELNDALQKLNKTKEKLDFHFVGNIPINKQLRLDNISLFYHGIVTEPKEKKIFLIAVMFWFAQVTLKVCQM